MRAKFLLIAAIMALAVPGSAQSAASSQDPKLMCSLYPAQGICEEVYRRAAGDKDNPIAASLRAEYQYYARYLGTTSRTLSAEDIAWLSNSGVMLPDTLTPEQIGGLHEVLADPNWQKDPAGKYFAVNGYLSRAAQAHFYCVFNDCPSSTDVASTPPQRAG